ncbi:MAG TPA: nucleoside-diphosphate sugar epimerase [Acidobacteria bacterium]|nr:nucleoside-diphosphate sugar epimerase [Acidobacteriota bacterium]
MKILVTGGLGAVGAPLSAALRAAGHEVWVLDRAHHHGVRGSHYYRCDVGEARQLQRVFEEVPFDFVYHAAAEFGRINGEDFYESLWRTNAVGTKNLIRLQEQRGFRMVVFSSSEIYGDWTGVMHEDVPSEHPIQQLNDYAVSKWVNELQVRNSAAVHGTETVTVRLFNTYGPGEPYSEYRSVICKFIYCALHGLPYTVYLNHRRTSTFIDDTVRTLATICERFRPGAVYNIAGNTLHDIKSVSDRILAQLGLDDRLVRYVDVEVHNTRDKISSNERARTELGHHETVGLDEGLARTIAWQRAYYLEDQGV